MNILIATQPIAGHVAPMAAIAHELHARGHRLRWYTGRKYAAQAERTGASFEPFVHARDYDDADFGAAFPGRDNHRPGLEKLRFDVREVFVGQIEGQLYDLRGLQRAWPHDLVLADQTVAAALLHEELGGPPAALLGVLPLGIVSRDTAPFGLGLPPVTCPWQRPAYRLLDRLTKWAVFGEVNRDLAALCRRMGLPERSFAPPVAPALMLQPSLPELEYLRSDLPPQLHFIGALQPPHVPRPLPEWWPQVQRSGRPLVLVTQGTLATDPQQLIWPTLQALAGDNVTVVAVGVDPQTLPPLPANAFAAAFVPFAQVLPQASVFVTNGGYGGVMQAMAAGVPCVMAGRSEDKAEVAARVAHAGAGLNLGTSRPRPAALRRAVQALLAANSPQRRQARRFAAELAQHDAPREAADLIEARFAGVAARGAAHA
ncbi:glycosyltransferase [Deinococcus sp. Marseille-Q6407]|uniref:glycosyltransferase n=1 Tax=Deinococcus sp. Marseille-Q6407 TaxID=2969223 RepID=UPI0021BE2B10|nr:nucleotide disphospho-sugar-binding domain-containing protein [Deinococcus sp. Marseille-Q6407]